MLQKPNCPVITLEEHYSDDELVAQFTGADATHVPALVNRLKEVGAERLKGMDEAGIDIQVLSHNSPSAQKLGADVAVPLTRRVNDRLAAIVKSNPKRFAGFAAFTLAAVRLGFGLRLLARTSLASTLRLTCFGILF